MAIDAPVGGGVQWREPVGLVVTPQEIKKVITGGGLEVYRTTGQEIIVADRVRDNLILDSGVRVRLRAEGPELEVRLIMGLRQGQYPNETNDQLFGRLRQLAAPALARGFAEVHSGVAAVNDPADTQKTLDTFFEVILAKPSPTAEVLDDVRFAMTIAKTAESRH